MLKDSCEVPATVGPAQGLHYLLFFDGGSRGNPGSGDRSSVVLRVGTDCTGLELCWVCSKAYGPPRTTSNVAESMGLLMGLKACWPNVWASLHVIGDSALILRQQRLRIPHTSEISIT
ncbi:hypothetical protein PI125_g22030 [Phytophthora idaei]|nr:hypothetical protein PI125_g22030 [Phytophthora idaei]